MTVLEFARKRLAESERQAALGSSTAQDDIRYWTLYIEGAEAQQKEFEKKIGDLKYRLSPAIATLEIIATNMAGRLASLEETDAEAVTLSNRVNAIDTAQEAMRLIQKLCFGQNAASGRDSPVYVIDEEEGMRRGDS